MSLSSGPSNFAEAFLERYREQVFDGIIRNLRNIYLANVKAHCTNGKVKNAAGMELDPDERFMRMIEERADLNEQACGGFRKCIWGAWCDGNSTSLLDSRLGPIFRRMAIEYQAVNKALMVYPNDLDLSVPK
jgi:hypothetical protein